MYKVEINPIDKAVIVTSRDAITKIEGEGIFEELTSKLKTIDPQNYFLVLDAGDLKPSAQDALPVMNRVMEIYMTTQFKNRYAILSGSTIANLQLKRVGTETLFNGLICLESYEEFLVKSKI